MRRLAFLAAAALAATLVADAAEAQQPRQLRFGSPWSTTSNLHAGIVKFAEELEKESGGRFRVLVYPDGQLGDISALVAGMQTGTVDLAYLGVGNASPLKGGAALNVTYVPYLFKSKQAAEDVMNGPIYAELFETVAKEAGIRIYAVYGQRSPRALLTTFGPVAKPADMKGRKLRVPPIESLRQFVIQLGGQPVATGLGDIYQAISRGQVDGQDNGIDATVAFKWYEVAKHWSVTDHVYESSSWYMSEKLWQSFSPGEQEMFRRGARAGGATMTKLGDELDARGLDILRQNGVTITQPDVAAFRDALKDLHKPLEGKAWPAGLVDRIRAAQR